MAHDETFNRLALLSGKANANTHVKDLTLQEIMRTPLKHGARPPLLVDVLRSAMAIGDHAKLVIEIKPGNSEIVDPLMQLFQRHPALLSRVAVIMSFDAYVIREISESLEGYRMQRQSGQFGRGLETINEGGSGTSLRRGSFSRASLFSRKKAVQSVSYGLSYTEDIHDNLPNLLVLTKAFPKDKKIVISVKDGFDGYDRKLPDGIDGVYLEYEPGMCRGNVCCLFLLIYHFILNHSLTIYYFILSMRWALTLSRNARARRPERTAEARRKRHCRSLDAQTS